MHGRDIISAMLVRKSITADDVELLRREVFQDGAADDVEAEAIFRLDEECTDKDAGWPQLYVDVLTDYFVWQTTPRGHVDKAHARYLMQRILRNNRIASATELELLVNIVHWAASVPTELSELVLLAVRESVLAPDEAAYGRGRRPKVIDAVDVELIKRAIYAPSTDVGITVTRREAEIIFELNDATVACENHPSWKQLFVFAVGNHLMFPRPHTPPPAAGEVMHRGNWLRARRGTFELLRRVGNEGLQSGSGQIDLGARFQVAMQAMRGPIRERDLDAEAREARIAYERETIDEEEAHWLIGRVKRDGVLHENETALLAFIRNTSPNIHASLEPLLRESGLQ
ncbi:MAG: hypothetical protein JSU82_00645 [Rhodospirillales bacterium]|nr:MAG: hypothetical protein JSU82_00645 [Rhodospirillales bacterium]